jgi:hypothetical protein
VVCDVMQHVLCCVKVQSEVSSQMFENFHRRMAKEPFENCSSFT